MIIGITGSSGSGKSTVCSILQKKYNVKIIDADKIAKQLSQNNKEYLADIVNQFGKEIILENGMLNRPKLADIIYNNEEKRELLNKCTFKYIKAEIQKEIGKYKDIIVIDAPLLFEAGLEKVCNITIAVISDNKELQIKRIMQRDNIERKVAIDRLNAQKQNEFYIKNCDYIIKNNGNIEDLNNQIDTILTYKIIKQT